jgi:hypothetical protein
MTKMLATHSSTAKFGNKAGCLRSTETLHARVQRLQALKSRLFARYGVNSLKSLPIGVQQDFAVAARRAGLALLASDCGRDVDVVTPERINIGESEELAIS